MRDRIDSGGATGVLAARGDAMLVEQGKSWATAAYCGTPMLHFGNSDTASWLNCDELGAGGGRWTPANLRKPDMETARHFFSWHFGARVFDPACVSLDRLLAHAHGTTGPDVIEANLAKLHDSYRQAPDGADRGPARRACGPPATGRPARARRGRLGARRATRRGGRDKRRCQRSDPRSRRRHRTGRRRE